MNGQQVNVAKPLPHYGNVSYLAFRQRINMLINRLLQSASITRILP